MFHVTVNNRRVCLSICRLENSKKNVRPGSLSTGGDFCQRPAGGDMDRKVDLIIKEGEFDA